MIGSCVICDREQAVEQNHLAGRANDPTTVLPFCLDCHRLFTGRQYGAGVNLGDGPREPVERLRGLAIGAALSLELFSYRRRAFVKHAPELWRLVGRAVSRLLDLHGGPDRHGRQLPDAQRAWRTSVRELPMRRDYDEHLEEFLDQLGFAIVQSLKATGTDQ